MSKELSKLDIIKAGKNATIMMPPATVKVFQPKLSRPRNIVKEQQSKIMASKQPVKNESLNESLFASQPEMSMQMGD